MAVELTRKSFTPYTAKKGEEYMNAAQRKHFRKILESLKAELSQEIDRTVHTMQDEATVFADPNDRASQESDMALELRNRDRERKLIKKIDETIARIDANEYGYCDSCGVEIGLKRLEEDLAPLVAVKENLKEFAGITYHPGWIPASFTGLPVSSYRFVHVDVDLYDPTLDTLAYFYPRLAPGGLIVSDDYSWPGARTAINEYCSEQGIKLQLSNFGQAVIRKRPQ